MRFGWYVNDGFIATAIFLSGALFFSIIGFQRAMDGDNGIYIYGGQRLLEGELPYVGIFDHKGPMAQFLAGAGVLLARMFGWQDWFGARILFFVLGIGSASLLYLAARACELNRTWSLAAAGLLLSFFSFGFFVASGPRPKVAFVFFQCLAIFLYARNRWVMFGASAGLAVLTWQPGILIAVAALLAPPRHHLTKSIASGLIGGLAVVATCALTYLVAGDLRHFIDGIIGFNVVDIQRSGEDIFGDGITAGGDIFSNARRIKDIIFTDYAYSSTVLVVGIAVITLNVFSPDRQRRYLGFLTLLLGLFTLLDIQAPDDFFPLLPLAAIGFAFAIDRLTRYAIDWQQFAIAAAICVVPLAALPLRLGLQYDGISRQVDRAERLADACPDPRCIYYLGDVNALALGGRENASRFGFVLYGIGRYIDRTEPGGLSGWLNGLSPDIVITGTLINGSGSGEIRGWLEENYKRAPEIDGAAWVRRATRD